LTGSRSDAVGSEADARLRDLDAENQALRRVVADQAIELRRLKDAFAIKREATVTDTPIP
jgi:hypothetical protein